MATVLAFINYKGGVAKTALVEALPSPDAKARMDADLESLIEFLQSFRAKLKSLPTDDGAEQIASTIEAVKDFV